MRARAEFRKFRVQKVQIVQKIGYSMPPVGEDYPYAHNARICVEMQEKRNYS